MTHLLFIRHGPTEWNQLKRLQGRTDIELSPDGRTEVEQWRVPAKYLEWNWVSSPLKRAVETAELLGITPSVDQALIEMSWGDWEGQVWQDLLAAEDPELDKNRSQGLDFRPLNGESPRDVQLRLISWISTLYAPTVAVSHKGVLQALYALATGWDIHSKPPVKIRNGCAHLFEVSRETCEVLEMNINMKVTK